LIVQYDYVKQRWDFKAAGLWFPNRDLARAHECALEYIAEQLYWRQKKEPEFEPDDEFFEEEISAYEQMLAIQRYNAAVRAARLRDQLEAEAWAALIVSVLGGCFRDKKEPNDLTSRLIELLERCVADEKSNASVAYPRPTLR
jgi:hypothetical protein